MRGRAGRHEQVPLAEDDVCRAGRLDPGDAEPEVANRVLDTLGLRAASGSTGARDDRQVTVDDHRVLDDDGIRAVVGRLDLHDLPAGIREGRGSADQRDGLGHGGGHREW